MEFLEHETNGFYHAWISMNYWTYLFIHCCINILGLIMICSELKKKYQMAIEIEKDNLTYW